MINLGENLKEAMRIKHRIEEKVNREAENTVGDKKQLVNRRILRTIRIMVAHINPMRKE